uniref:arginyltransferase n=1 Tax=Thaumasiovibrio occultus TaxID=1891184 RepID=UPI000B3534E1|nr:arginyltransferase [Thaumasiovibrio occultus]
MSFTVGLTPSKPCSYLPEQQDQLMVVMDDEWHSRSHYRLLMDHGFRRSGDMIYRPNCPECKACQSIRVDCAYFSPSRSQRRILNKASNITAILKNAMDEDWFSLYSRYIEQRHADGSMYPPNKDDFARFSASEWMQPQYLHLYDNQEGKLIAIAVCDRFNDGLSALYTFFDPDSPLALGTLAILFQIKFAQTHQLRWLYLGYQVDECPAMSYKTRYKPCQRWVDGEWRQEAD